MVGVQVPNEQNVRYIPPAEEITDASPDTWALYPGSWGAGSLFLDDNRIVTCLFDDFTRAGECDRSSDSFQLLSQVLRTESVANLSQATQQASQDSEADFGNHILGAAQRTGPLQRDYSYTWLQERPAPIYEQLTAADDTVRCCLCCSIVASFSLCSDLC